MNYPTVDEVLEIHEEIIDHAVQQGLAASGGLRDRGLLESAVGQPQAGFGGHELYPTLADKAAVLAFGIIKNHPFVDANKRTGYLALLAFLDHNDFKLDATEEEEEDTILRVASGEMSREDFRDWVKARVTPA